MAFSESVIRCLLVVAVCIYDPIVLSQITPNGMYCRKFGRLGSSKISFDFHGGLFDLDVKILLRSGSAKNIGYTMNGEDQIKIDISNPNLKTLFDRFDPPVSLESLQYLGYQNDELATFVPQIGLVIFKKSNC
ncbi:hypothetical protein FOL47_000761 [Perkinsus chesapeaki]|uniref:Uncharacterized protein n=1 Tax=Perkinsus chesapeaki TaxID=330153 RepID=A0A7J6ML83_PERCH|nr:hypothetical protein FOL47_000761 [Perkinsus chesapeaki]